MARPCQAGRGQAAAAAEGPAVSPTGRGPGAGVAAEEGRGGKEERGGGASGRRPAMAPAALGWEEGEERGETLGK